MKVLLVEPDFPYPNKSKQKANEVHKNFVPIGLLKLGAYHKSKGDAVKLVRGKKSIKELDGFKPDAVFVTSLFTYWSGYVWEAIGYYREIFPGAEITLGGIYATLHHETAEFKRLSKRFKVFCHVGLHSHAEKFLPDYSLLSADNDYHVMHAMRGCIRRCGFCGTWKIEPKLFYKNAEQVTLEIRKVKKSRIIFYDNNFLANPNIKEILNALVGIRNHDKTIAYESQSGFDGRILEKDPELASLIKRAGFSNIRIAWDNGVKDKDSIKRQIDLLTEVGYLAKDVSVFMIYNFNIPLDQMIFKQKCCLSWGVQITDCRYRPLESTFDNYSSHVQKIRQSPDDYYIHAIAGWTDDKIRLFRRLIRIHNIFIRYVKDKTKNFNVLYKRYEKIKNPAEVLEFMKIEMGYKKDMEKWSAIHNTFKFFNLGRPLQLGAIRKDKVMQNVIMLLDRAKAICKKNNLEPATLENLSWESIEKKLIHFLKIQDKK